MQLLRLKRDFLEHLELSLGRKAKTIENYDRYLTRFLTFTKIKKPTELTEEKIFLFKQYLDKQVGTRIGGKFEPMKQKTQNYFLIALRAFLKYLHQRGVNSLLPEKIKLAKVFDGSPNLISNAELKRLLATTPLTTIEGKRDRAILELLVSTGLRISELCNLQIVDFEPVRKELSVRGDGGKNRVVPLSVSAINAIKKYLSSRKDNEEALFIRYGKKAHIGDESRITARSVQRLLKYYAGKAGITEKVTPQVIRHSLAVRLLKNGASIVSVQVLLGHANISTTKIYTHIDNTNLKVGDTKRKSLS